MVDAICATPTEVTYPQESWVSAHLIVDVHIENPAASDLGRVLIQWLGLGPVFKTHHLLRTMQRGTPAGYVAWGILDGACWLQHDGSRL